MLMMKSGAKVAAALREQRQHPRARLLTPAPLEIEIAGRSVVGGKLVDLSRSGLQIRLPKPLPAGCRLAGEIRLPGAEGVATFSGVAVHRRELPGAVQGVGVRFDSFCQRRDAVLEDVIRRALAREEGGRAQAIMIRVLTMGGAPKVKVYGALCGHGWRELMAAVKRFGAVGIDLSDATWIDPAGIALCMIANERHGAHVERCSRYVKEIMNLARMCGKLCAGPCLSSPIAIGRS